MIPGDFLFLVAFFAISTFLVIPDTRHIFEIATTNQPVIMAFLKFAVLATSGEWIARRLRIKSYSVKNFGLLPKAIIWGILGVFISWAFIIFSNGVPKIFPNLAALQSTGAKFLVSFLISLFMNSIFAPWMMLIHHLTDHQIASHNGRFAFSDFNTLSLLQNIDWKWMWNFVFKKTIPLFWIPAHTITFLLPGEYRVLFAAGLSVILGLILGSVRKKQI